MEPLTWMILIAAALIAICVIGLVARVFLKLLKFVIFAVIIAVIAGLAWTQFQPRSQDTATPLSKPSPRPRQQ